MPPAQGIEAQPDDLPALREVEQQFPQFAVWREALCDRIRYIARARDLSTRLHTVVTADLGELRAALTEAVPAVAPDTGEDGPAAPNVARMYDFWRGGKDNLAPDRQAAATITGDFPEVAAIAKANRHFVTRAVSQVAAQGITQFLDLGAGLPAWPAVHQAAREHAPDAAVAYLDHDPVVLAHARALYTDPGISVIHADLVYPKAILADRDLRAAIDFTQPVCLILAAVLHFLRPAEADHTVRVLTAALAPGSYLVISAGTATGTDPALLARLRAAYTHTTPISARTHDEIATWFTGFTMIRPGLVDVRDWRPARHRPSPARTHSAAQFLAGAGVKTHPAPTTAISAGSPPTSTTPTPTGTSSGAPTHGGCGHSHYSMPHPAPSSAPNAPTT